MRAVVVKQGPDHKVDLRVLARRHRAEVDMIEHEPAQLGHRAADQPALDDVACRLGMLDEIVNQRVDPPLTAIAEDLDRAGGQSPTPPTRSWLRAKARAPVRETWVTSRVWGSRVR